MRIIFNHTLRSIKMNIAQSIVIVFTIAVVTMLFFASLSLSELFYNFQYYNLSRLAGETDILISGGIFSDERLSEFVDDNATKIEYVDKYLITAGLIGTSEGKEEQTAVMLEITDLNAFIEKHSDSLTFYKGINKDIEYIYPEIWVSKSLAEANGYKIGTEAEIYLWIFGRYETFTITYIFENEGIFANSTVHNILTDINSFGNKGLYSDAYIKLTAGTDKQQLMDSLSAYMNNPDLQIENAVDYDYIERVVEDNENLLKIVLIFIVALVIFILFGAYVIVAKNRASEMLIFKAVGATPVQSFLILLLEGVFYGVIGGLLGTVMGRFGMEIVVRNVIPGFSDAVVYTVWNYILSFCLGIIMSLLSAVVPIYKLVKSTVRQQSSSGIKRVKKVHPLILIIPLIIIISGVLCVILLDKYTGIFTIIITIGVIMMIITGAPYLISGLANIFANFQGLIKPAVLGIKRNSEAISLSCMLGAIIAFTFVTVSIVTIIIDASRPFNSRFDGSYAIQTINENIDMKEVDTLLDNKFGVDYSALLSYEEYNITLNDRETNLLVYSVSKSEDLSCVTTLTNMEKEMFDNTENSAVFSYDMLNRINKKVGDNVKLTLNGTEYEFNVVAVDSKKTSTDRVIFVNDDYFGNNCENSVIILDISENVSHSDIYNEIKSEIESNDCFILALEDWTYATSLGVDGIATLLRILQIIVGIVGFIGIENMTTSMIISRKKEFIIYKALGLNKKKKIKFLYVESFLISCVGAIIGVIFSIVSNTLIPTFAMLIDRYIQTAFPWEAIIIAVISSIIYSIIYCIIGISNYSDESQIERNAI